MKDKLFFSFLFCFIQTVCMHNQEEIYPGKVIERPLPKNVTLISVSYLHKKPCKGDFVVIREVNNRLLWGLVKKHYNDLYMVYNTSLTDEVERTAPVYHENQLYLFYQLNKKEK